MRLNHLFLLCKNYLYAFQLHSVIIQLMIYSLYNAYKVSQMKSFLLMTLIQYSLHTLLKYIIALKHFVYCFI